MLSCRIGFIVSTRATKRGNLIQLKVVEFQVARTESRRDSSKASGLVLGFWFGLSLRVYVLLHDGSLGGDCIMGELIHEWINPLLRSYLNRRWDRVMQNGSLMVQPRMIHLIPHTPTPLAMIILFSLILGYHESAALVYNAFLSWYFALPQTLTNDTGRAWIVTSKSISKNKPVLLQIAFLNYFVTTVEISLMV